MSRHDPKPGRDERLDAWNGRDPKEWRCRLCRRVMIEHASKACRTCRAGKPTGWIVGQDVKETEVVDEVLDDEDDDDLVAP